MMTTFLMFVSGVLFGVALVVVFRPAASTRRVATATLFADQKLPVEDRLQMAVASRASIVLPPDDARALLVLVRKLPAMSHEGAAP